MRNHSMNDEKFMRLAIRKARQGVKRGQTPFGACIACKGKVVVAAHNEVFAHKDITAHAEINALHTACRRLGRIDLSDCVIYSTTEPCPMCFTACHWAKIPTVFYGTRIADAARHGFSEWPISDRKMELLGKSKIKLVPGFLRKECLELFDEWSKGKKKRTY